eukprot:scaffold14651_cov34-Prasinocladus_malaysianus.AAC.2
MKQFALSMIADIKAAGVDKPSETVTEPIKVTHPAKETALSTAPEASEPADAPAAVTGAANVLPAPVSAKEAPVTATECSEADGVASQTAIPSIAPIGQIAHRSDASNDVPIAASPGEDHTHSLLDPAAAADETKAENAAVAPEAHGTPERTDGQTDLSSGEPQLGQCGAVEPPSGHRYAGSTVAALREVLRERGLRLAGTKAELIQRLEEADAAASAYPKALLQ